MVYEAGAHRTPPTPRTVDGNAMKRVTMSEDERFSCNVTSEELTDGARAVSTSPICPTTSPMWPVFEDLLRHYPLLAPAPNTWAVDMCTSLQLLETVFGAQRLKSIPGQSMEYSARLFLSYGYRQVYSHVGPLQYAVSSLRFHWFN